MLLVRGQPTDAPPPPRAARRATLAFVLVALGELAAMESWRAGHALPAAAWYGIGLLVVAGAVLARTPWKSTALLSLACLVLAGAHFTRRILEPAPRSLEMLLSEDPQRGSLVQLEGVVLEQERLRDPPGALARFLPRPASTTLLLRSRSAETDAGPRPIEGKVRVMIRGGRAPVEPGACVRVTGIARRIEPPGNPGEGDARLWARQDGLACLLDVASPDLVVEESPSNDGRARFGRSLIRARGWLRGRAAAVLDPDESTSERPGRAVLAALLLGENEVGDLRSAFARQGLAHVLAISGFHLAVMAAAALFAIRLTGERGRLEAILVAMLVVAYVAILPARAPVLRAAAMVMVFLAAEASGRRYDRRALLAWIAIGVLLIRPMDLFSLGYQLTFGITAVLVWFGEAVHKRLFRPALTFARREPPDPLERRWWTDRAKRLFSASLLCWAAATPLVARTTGVVSPTALLSTLVVIPVVTVLLWAGYAALLVGIFIPAAGSAASVVLDALSGALLRIVGAFDGVAWTTIYAPRISLGLATALTSLAMWWLVRARLREPGTWAATILAMGWLAGELWTSGRLRYGTVLRVDTLDVGDGTCHLIRSAGEAMLWDCGSLNPSIGVRTIPRALRELGVWHVPEAVVTHPNFDHFCAMPDIARQFGLRRVFVSKAFLDRADAEPGGATAHAALSLAALGVEIRELSAGDEIALGAARLRILSPPRGATFSADNDHSLVALARVPVAGGERRLLFCGDIQREAMAALLAPDFDISADVLEIPHHGSAQPATAGFLEAVDPLIVLQSTGPSRAFDGRWDAQRGGRTWWTTAPDGAAWVEVGRDGGLRSGCWRRTAR